MLGVLPPLPQGPSLKDTYPSVKDGFAAAAKRNALPESKALRTEELPAATVSMVEELLENSHPFGNQKRAQQGGGPTDFSGLFPRGPSTDCQPESKRARTLRTFQDIASQRQTRAALKEIPKNFELPSHLAAPAAANAAGLATAGVARELPPSAAAPLDWSLKTTARFSSPMPFSILDDAQQAPSREVAQVQRILASCSGTLGLSLRQQYLASLLSFQHPQAPLPAAAVGGGRGRSGAPDAPTLARRQDWQAAFASLYDNFRNGQCAAFYYAAPEGSSKGFVAFFGAAGVGGRQRVHAILTRSTAGTRALLQQGLGLGFATPLMPSGGEGAAGEGQGGTSQSMLLFEGALRVHGLFDFLLNESWKLHGAECDVPLLLSPTSFLHGCLKAHQPKVLGVDSKSKLHRLELQGLLPPWVLDRLAAVFAVTQNGDFSMMCDTHQHTLSLNWQPSSCKEAAAEDGLTPMGDYSARESGCLDAEEAARWQQAVPGLSCNVVRELRCEAGVFSARLSDKSAARLG